MRILIVTGEAIPSSEGRNLELAAELMAWGHEVRHTGPARIMARKGFTTTTFDPAFAELPQARACRTRLFTSWPELRRMIAWAELVLFSTAKDYREIARYARDLGKVIIWQCDFSTHGWAWYADRVAATSHYDAERLAAFTGLDRSIFRATGSVCYDQADPKHQRLTRAQFCAKYGLDGKKLIAVWLSHKPGVHSPDYKERYRKICGIIGRHPDYDLIIKPHPREYERYRQEKTYLDAETPTWTQLAPGVPACEAEDKWDCLRHADILISRQTGTVVDASLFGKPFLLVDNIEFWCVLYGLEDPNLLSLLPRRRFKPPGLAELNPVHLMESCLGQVDDPRVRRLLDRARASREHKFPTGYLEYVGTECTLGELEGVLSTQGWRVEDEGLFKDYVARYCLAGDGRAYQRVADLVESVQADPVLSAKLARAGSGPRRWAAHLAWRAKEIAAWLNGRLRPREQSCR